jgi:Ulp1 family protease
MMLQLLLNHVWSKKVNAAIMNTISHCKQMSVTITNFIYLFILSVPFQTNKYDCGVFVCHYAYALYQVHCNHIQYADIYLEKPPLKTAISENQFFQFDGTEITTMRCQFGVHLDRLHDLQNLM